ncbi:polyisoprenoid-binding protein [Cytophagales bacterium WSM2-2]|nr:polyisoprenoid-binding protein [Cytophagales bacterium WSM2-2]
MKTSGLSIVASLVTGFAVAQTNWSVDKAHSRLGFSVSHMMVSETTGSIEVYEANISSKNEDFSDALVELRAEAGSINTGDPNRDKHLKGPDFFDAEKFNVLTFKSKTFTKIEGKKYKVTGDLTLRGITKTVTLELTFNGIYNNNNKTIAGFKVVGILKRSDFSIGLNIPSAVVGDEVNILVNAEFVKS